MIDTNSPGCIYCTYLGILSFFFYLNQITNIKHQKKIHTSLKTAAIGKESKYMYRKKALLRYEEVYFFASWLYY